MSLKMALQNMMWLSLPVIIYALVMRWRAQTKICERLGLKIGNPHFYLIALAACIPISLSSIWISSKTSSFSGSMIAPFLGASPSPENIARILIYGFLSTGFPEELLFRGLIAGSIFRRLAFWKANVIQAAIFTLPHFLILFIAPSLWPLVICVPFGLGLLLGWLRYRSGSIGPSVLVHALGNMAGAFAVMNWGL